MKTLEQVKQYFEEQDSELSTKEVYIFLRAFYTADEISSADITVISSTRKIYRTHIINHSLPDGICFDHDLGEEKTGYDCAKWLVDYCMDNNLKLPLYAIQSANPVGKEIGMCFI